MKRGTWSSPETPDETDALGGDGPETSAPPVDLDSPDASDEPLTPARPVRAGPRGRHAPHAPSDIHLQAPGKWSPIAYAFLGTPSGSCRAPAVFAPARPLEYDLKCKRAVRAEAQDAVLRTLLARRVLHARGDEDRQVGTQRVVRERADAPAREEQKQKQKRRRLRVPQRDALECVVGYLYMTDLPRLEEMMAGLGVVIERVARENDTR